MKTRAKSYTFPKKSLILTHKPPFFAKAIFIANRKGLLRYWKTLMTLNDRDRKWPLFQISKNDSKGDFCNQMQNRKHLYLYTSVTYELFLNILREKACFLLRFFVSLHRQSKEQSSCAKSRSSMTTEAGLNRWQAPVINEDHKMGRKRLSGELWFKELLNADWAWQTKLNFFEGGDILT